jgi:predicted nucleic acid-binding protein
MPPVLVDTSVYVSAFRASNPSTFNLTQKVPGAVVWLSAVVLEELYAGTTPTSLHLVEKLERDFEGANRILVPNLSDWVRAGRLLSRVASECDFEEMGRARLTNDALIAMSAGRVGFTVITSNAKDFARLAKFRKFSWTLA